MSVNVNGNAFLRIQAVPHAMGVVRKPLYRRPSVATGPFPCVAATNRSPRSLFLCTGDQCVATGLFSCVAAPSTAPQQDTGMAARTWRRRRRLYGVDILSVAAPSTVQPPGPHACRPENQCPAAATLRLSVFPFLWHRRLSSDILDLMKTLRHYALYAMASI